MPIIKTDVSLRTRANVAYAAAMLGLSESEIYGQVLDRLVGGQTPDDFVRNIAVAVKKGEKVNDAGSKDPQ